MSTMLDQAIAHLMLAGIENPKRDAKLLLAHVLREFSHDKKTYFLNLNVAQRFSELITRRTRHEPISRILGIRGFWTFDLRLNVATFDPRPETETIVELILESVDHNTQHTILDLGTGGGGLLLSLLSELPNAVGLGIDILPGAITMAYTNASLYNLTSRACFQVGNWAESVFGKFDCIVSNPPYIAEYEMSDLGPEVILFDPYCSFVGGNDGLDAYRTIVPYFYQSLQHKGIVALEIGYKQADLVTQLMKNAGLAYLKCRPDISGTVRGMLFQKI